MKRHEREFEMARWYQEDTYFDPATCQADGTKLVAELSPIGTVNLACPYCGLATSKIPPYIFEMYARENSLQNSAKQS